MEQRCANQWWDRANDAEKERNVLVSRCEVGKDNEREELDRGGGTGGHEGRLELGESESGHNLARELEFISLFFLLYRFI